MQHLDELCQLSAGLGRPRHLIMIGGMTALPILASAFARVSYIDTSAFMNAVHRQRLYLASDGKVKKRGELTRRGQAIDGLFVDNLATMRTRVEMRHQ